MMIELAIYYRACAHVHNLIMVGTRIPKLPTASRHRTAPSQVRTVKGEMGVCVCVSVCVCVCSWSVASCDSWSGEVGSRCALARRMALQ